MREYHLLCRGGIYEGFYYSEGNIAFGPALVQAYLLQENVAVNPRIIMPRHVYDVYRSMCDDKSLINDLCDLIQIEADEEFFIADYIGFSIRRCACDVVRGVMPQVYAKSLFWSIKNLIEDELACNTNKRVRDKYIYLRDYYNAQLDMLRHEADNMGISIPFEIRKVFGSDNGRDQ